MPNNYGDCSLQLKPDWSRSKLAQNQFTLSIVGHEGGVADIRLVRDPEARYQFQRVDPKDTARVDMFRTLGYEWCVLGEDKWEKNPNLWIETADHMIECFGCRFMARPERFWLAEQEARRETAERKALRKNDEAALAAADRLGGFSVMDDNDRPMRPMRRAR